MTDYTDETKYKILDGGAVYGLEEGKIVAHLPGGKYAITKDNSRQMLARKKQLVQLATLRGLARKVGVNVDEATLEEIAAGAGTAIENLAGHNYQTFMNSSNLRGQGENLRALLALLGVEKEEAEVHHIHDVTDGTATALLEALREALQPQAIDGKVIE
jgi:hypothetical protein